MACGNIVQTAFEEQDVHSPSIKQATSECILYSAFHAALTFSAASSHSQDNSGNSLKMGLPPQCGEDGLLSVEPEEDASWELAEDLIKRFPDFSIDP
ncbi:hypothetical protein Tco_0073192 [Tanacetum coccineum]